MADDVKKPVDRRECTIRTKDGRVRSVVKNIDCIRDTKGRIVGGIESFEDVTDNKKSEEKLRQLSQAVEQSPSTVVITDTDGAIEYVNPRFTDLTGYKLHEVVGMNPRILKSGDKPDNVYKELWDTIKAGRTWHGEFLNRKKSGETYWEFAAISAIKDRAGNVTNYLKVAEDITERKQIEKIKDVFISTVSHELRTPLTAIKESIGIV
jgi:PAS domain S-box-containing protein